MHWRKIAAALLLLMSFGIGAKAGAAPPSEWQFGKDRNGDVCRAALLGENVNTRLLRNRDNKIVLIAGRSDWDHWQRGFPLRIQVDGGPAVDVVGHGVGPLVLVLIEDQTLTEKLRSAETVEWHLPWGNYRASVKGLGAAFDAIKVCAE